MSSKIKQIMCVSVLGLVASTGAVWAEGPVLDGAVQYSARHSILNPNTGGTDNDILLGTVGVTWDSSRFSSWRLAFSQGLMIDQDQDRSSNYQVLEGHRIFEGNARRSLIGARFVRASDLTRTTEIAGIHERFGFLADWADARAMVGFQGIDENERVNDRDGSSVFGLGEFSIYPSDDAAFRVAISSDSDGDLGTLVYEQKLGQLPFSIYAEYADTLSEYRGFDGYNDFTVGIRYLPNERSVRSDNREGTVRSMRRYAEVQ